MNLLFSGCSPCDPLLAITTPGEEVRLHRPGYQRAFGHRVPAEGDGEDVRARADKKAVSLDLEVGTPEKALRGALALQEELESRASDGLGRTSLASTLTVVVLPHSRVRLPRAAVRRELEPAHLRTTNNEAGGEVDAHETLNVHLVEWTKAERAEARPGARASGSKE